MDLFEYFGGLSDKIKVSFSLENRVSSSEHMAAGRVSHVMSP